MSCPCVLGCVQATFLLPPLVYRLGLGLPSEDHDLKQRTAHAHPAIHSIEGYAYVPAQRVLPVRAVPRMSVRLT